MEDSLDPEVTLARREAIEKATGKQLPGAGKEHNDPAAATGRYGTAIDEVRAKVREDAANKILSDVNASSGFRRNAFAVRQLDRLGSGGSFIAAVVLWCASVTGYPTTFLWAACAEAFLASFWWLLVSEEWVHRDANRYADQFFLTVYKMNAGP
jgi:hypothetical protein